MSEQKEAEDERDREGFMFGNSPDPLYDEDMDNRDAAWVTKQLLQHSKSDAVLSCPCCFTTLCFDCQQHSVYKDQFRAMFVTQCRIEWSRTVRPIAGEDVDPSEIFYPVVCNVCATEVAAYDQEQVYHFFHVLPSSA